MFYVTQIYRVVTVCLGVVAVLNIAYLLLLLLAAQAATRKSRRAVQPRFIKQSCPAPRLLVVIPAHNEELVLAATLTSLNAQDYPSKLYRVVVVADNCTDATEQIAHDYGVLVLKRRDLDRRGKGYALEWAFAHLLSATGGSFAEASGPDAFVILDADTWAAPDFLSLMAKRLQTECAAEGQYRTLMVALQGRYGVLNQEEGWRAALMAGAFDLFNHVKPLGQDCLAMSIGLKGNGMAFTRPILEKARWRGHSVTEDIDYGLDLLYHHGVRVGYVPEARVRAQMPTTAAQAASQRDRWEGGRYRLMRERTVPLFIGAIRRQDIRLLDATCGLLSLPLSELVVLLTLLTLLVVSGSYFALLSGQTYWQLTVAGLWVAFVTYVIGGFRIAGAPRQVYASLLKAPFYAVWKLALYGSRLFRRDAKCKPPGGSEEGMSASPEWVRTERTAITVDNSLPSSKDDGKVVGEESEHRTTAAVR